MFGDYVTARRLSLRGHECPMSDKAAIFADLTQRNGRRKVHWLPLLDLAPATRGTRGKDTAVQQQALTSLAYAQGRQARFEQEQWFNGLPEGDYKVGAAFWVAHRSDKPQPSCFGGSAAWQTGCLTARARFAPIDQRRTTEKDFWLGWNSL